MGRPQADARDRPHGPPGRRRRARPVRRDQRAGDRGRRQEPSGPGIDFFPLTVNYQEKTYAAGKIPGGFFKREGRPTEKETLTSRLIDRPIRPLFVDGFKHETQVDRHRALARHGERSRHRRAWSAASAALTLSGLPFLGPDRRCPRRRHRRPVRAQPDDRRDGRERARPRRRRHRRRRDDGGVGGQGAAREADARGRHVRPPRLPAGDRGDHQARREGAPRSRGTSSRPTSPSTSRRPRRWSRPTCARRSPRPRSRSATSWSRPPTPRSRRSCLPADADASEQVLLGAVFKGLEQDVVRGDIIRTGKRIDGRDLKTVRPIRSEVHVLPRTHGSALFTRGETQALVVATLGTGEDEQYHRRARGHAQGALHAALQLPALLGRRDRPHGLARPARDRPRQARLARGASAAARARGVPLHDPRRLRDHRVQRLLVDGDRLRRLAGADGCRRAAQAPRSPASPWA